MPLPLCKNRPTIPSQRVLLSWSSKFNLNEVYGKWLKAKKYMRRISISEQIKGVIIKYLVRKFLVAIVNDVYLRTSVATNTSI